MSGVKLIVFTVLALVAASYAASSPNYNELGSDGGYKVFALEATQDRGKFDCLWDAVASPARGPVLARAIFIGNKNPLIGIAIPVLNGTYYNKEDVIDTVKFPDVSEYWANFFNIPPETLTMPLASAASRAGWALSTLPDTPIGLKHNQSYHFYNQLEATEPVDTCVVDQLICPVSGPEGTGWEGMNFFAFPNVQALMLAVQQLDNDPTRQNQNEWLPKGFTGGQMRYMGAAMISRYHADNLTPPLVCSARVAIRNDFGGSNYRQFFADLRVHGASAPIPAGWSLELRGIDPNGVVSNVEGFGGTSVSASNGAWTLSFSPSVNLDEDDSLCDGHSVLLQGGLNLSSSCDTLQEPEWAILHTSDGSMHCYVESFQPSMSGWPNQCDNLLP